MIAPGIPKNFNTENELFAKHCQQIKDGTLILPEESPQSPNIKKDQVVDMKFECVTDLATSWKYFNNRVQTLEMFNEMFGKEGKAVLKDSMTNAWTFEKANKSYNYFKNEVLVENKQMDKDIHVCGADGAL